MIHYSYHRMVECRNCGIIKMELSDRCLVELLNGRIIIEGWNYGMVDECTRRFVEWSNRGWYNDASRRVTS